MNSYPIANNIIRYKIVNNCRMIKWGLYTCITVIFFSDWLYFVFGIGSRYISWAPEFFSMFLSIYIPAVMAKNKEWRISAKYTVLLIIYMIHIIVGLLVNSVAIGPMIAGTRQFFRFIPIFILPAVIHFGEKDIRKLIKFLLFLALIQFPVTIWQRFFLYANISSGDPIGGTLGANTSGVLSIFLLMVLSFITAFYLKGELPFRFFVPLCIIIFIPTTINETKVTLPLLPLSLILPVIFAKQSLTKALSKTFNLSLILLLTLFLFITIYNSYDNRNIVKFYSQKDHVGNYSEGRLVPILTALKNVFNGGFITMIYGYGAGNVSVSFSKSFESKASLKFSVYEPDKVSITKLLWETGYLGTLIFLLLLALIVFDSFKILKRNLDFLGTFALGMFPTTIILSISFFYTKPLDQNIFLYLFFFFSGYLISEYHTNK